MSVSGLSDLIAQIVYPATFVVCMTWVAIAIAHATSRERHCIICYTMLALAMLFSALAFGLLAFNAGRDLFQMIWVLIWFRSLMTLATVFGVAFTVIYLARIFKKGRM